MKFIVNNIITTVDEGSCKAPSVFLAKTGLKNDEINALSLFKTSVDARHKKPSFVSSVILDLKNDDSIKKVLEKGYQVSPKNDEVPYFGEIREKPKKRPIVVGFGPCGMFCALVLARTGCRPIVLERGYEVEKRVEAVKSFWDNGIFNEKCNVQFGEGGAGTFSDGKLTTRINDPLCSYILREFVKNGAPPEILTKAKPHVGTDFLRSIVKNIREEIISLGGEVRFSEKVVDLRMTGGKIFSVLTENDEIQTDDLIIAIGHSARDTFSMLSEKGFLMEAKGFSAGVRIEQLQTVIDEGLYGNFVGHKNLPSGEYQLSLRKNDRAAYTFCMCPGGMVVNSASEENSVVTNGMSNFGRNLKNANSALVVSVSPKDFDNDWRKAVNFQRELEKAAYEAGGSNYKAPFTTVGAFLGGKFKLGRVTPSFSNGAVQYPIEKLMPKFMKEMLSEALPVFERRLNGFGAWDSVMTGFETRTSSPLRIIRNDTREAVGFDGVFLSGEGAGYAGGIVSAAVDGIKTAMSVMEKYKE